MTHRDSNGNLFPKLSNDLILKAALNEPTDRVPVWIMRQAGRYLPEFRELRQRHSFFEICESPELSCQVTLMPIKRFDLDAAIIFSDILVIPQALGMTVEMLDKKGPHFPHPLDLEDKFALDKLDRDVDISKRLAYSYQAITITRHALEGRCPLIGFSGAPWTLMCYMIEGGGSKTMSKAKKWLYQDPSRSQELLSMLTSKVADHLVEQAKAGAQLLQLFESNAEYLNLELFQKFAFPCIEKICFTVKARLRELSIDRVPIVVFAKGAHYAINFLVVEQNKPDRVFDVLSLDWTMDPCLVRGKTKLCLQGNLDPCCMYCDPKEISAKISRMLQQFGTQSYIANLGHGIYPDANIETVREFVDSVHRLSSNDGANVNGK